MAGRTVENKNGHPTLLRNNKSVREDAYLYAVGMSVPVYK